MTLRSTRVTVASGIEFRLFRGGDGAKVLYLHPGSELDADDAFANALARRFHVIAPVAPAPSDPRDPAIVLDIHDRALAYDDLLSVLRVRKIDVVGHSLGGMTAAEVAAHSPHRVDRLALIAPMGLANDDEDHGLRRRLYRLSMPTLLLWGSDDPIVPPRVADEFAAGIDNAKIKLIPDAGHMVTLEKTKKVLDALSRYFGR